VLLEFLSANEDSISMDTTLVEGANQPAYILMPDISFDEDVLSPPPKRRRMDKQD